MGSQTKIACTLLGLAGVVQLVLFASIGTTWAMQIDNDGGAVIPDYLRDTTVLLLDVGTVEMLQWAMIGFLAMGIVMAVDGRNYALALGSGAVGTIMGGGLGLLLYEFQDTILPYSIVWAGFWSAIVYMIDHVFVAKRKRNLSPEDVTGQSGEDTDRNRFRDVPSFDVPSTDDPALLAELNRLSPEDRAAVRDFARSYSPQR
ncbi:MAG: hypothetical protein WD603_01005 [Patescibacteria group bacterium]